VSRPPELGATLADPSKIAALSSARASCASPTSAGRRFFARSTLNRHVRTRGLRAAPLGKIQHHH